MMSERLMTLPLPYPQFPHHPMQILAVLARGRHNIEYPVVIILPYELLEPREFRAGHEVDDMRVSPLTIHRTVTCILASQDQRCKCPSASALSRKDRLIAKDQKEIFEGKNIQRDL